MLYLRLARGVARSVHLPRWSGLECVDSSTRTTCTSGSRAAGTATTGGSAGVHRTRAAASQLSNLSTALTTRVLNVVGQSSSRKKMPSACNIRPLRISVKHGFNPVSVKPRE
jgi:hypothetical protein